VPVRRDTTGRSVQMKTAAGQERDLAYGEILVAAGRRGYQVPEAWLSASCSRVSGRRIAATSS
jgi:hypothetical protein